METHNKPSRWAGMRFVLARLGWLVLAAPTVVIHILSLYVSAQSLLEPGADPLLQQVGLPRGVAVVLTVTMQAAAGLLCLGAASLLFARLLRRGEKHDYMTIFTAYMLLTFSLVLNNNTAQFPTRYPFWDDVLGLIGFSGAVMFMLFLLRFPTGKYVPRVTVWLPRLALIWMALWIFYPPLSPNNLSQAQTNMVVATFIGVAAAAQVYRYVRVSSPMERQQIKWVAYSLFMLLGLEILSTLSEFLAPGWNLFPENPISALVQQTIGNLMWVLFPISLVAAMLRYHLWEIDRLINKTLVYTLLSLILGGGYFGSVMILQMLLSPRMASGGSGASTPVIVVSTLGAAALFSPLRAALQRWIDRRFYRSRYHAGRVLAEFGEFARTEVSLEKLAARVTSVVEETLQPSGVSLWLIDGGARSPQVDAAWKMLLEVEETQQAAHEA